MKNICLHSSKALYRLTTCFSIALALSLPEPAAAQKDSTTTEKYNSYLYMGLGLGLDYGSIGARVEFMALDYLGIFGAVGYTFTDLGYNAGLTFRALPQSQVTPVLTAMYGYNGSIKGDAYGYNISQNYFGFSFGAGAEFRFGRRNTHINANILIPVRSEEFKQDIRWVHAKNVIPVSFSLGINLAI